MRFTLIDQIIDLQPHASITAIKGLTAAEEYLADHFPKFAVMPGVLMLETMYQASAWLVRYSDDFASSLVLLREARNVKFADFVSPGQVLRVSAEIVKHDAHTTTLKAQGDLEGKVAVTARLVLQRSNQADRDPTLAAVDAAARRRWREQFLLLYRGETLAASEAAE